MVKCIDRTELAQKITEVLARTQFTAWILPNDADLTAEDARDYFLSYFKDPNPTTEQKLACSKFNRVIDKQTVLIMELLDV